ncbi:retrotransposon protein, putative, ty1-copia subclass [Tanacetum coccineum]
MCNYLKNMEGYKLQDLKLRGFDSIKEMFDRAFKMVNTFDDFRTELVEGREKRAGTELIQENAKKQKVEDDKETTELKQCLEIIPDEEEVTIDAIPLAIKSPSIVGWKIHKEGRKCYYQIIRADGKSQMYIIFSHMLKSFNKEDLEDLYKLVKAKYKSTIPVEDLDLLLWGDLKTMFEPHVEDKIWRKQQDYKVLDWKLYNSCEVHSLRMEHMQIYMLVEKKYPFAPLTLSMMLEKKLIIDYESEMAYQLLKFIIKQLKNKSHKVLGIALVEIIDRQLPFEYTIASRSTNVMVLVLRVEKKLSINEQPISHALTGDSAANVLAEWNTVFDAHNEEEGKPVGPYVIKMKNYVAQLECLVNVLLRDLSVGLIMNGLTSNFAGFVRNYNKHNMGKTIGELHSLLSKDKGKGKGKDKSYISKTKNPKTSAKEHSTKNDACRHHCKEVGHCKRNCPAYLAELIKKKKQVGTASNGVRVQVEAIGSYDLVLPNGLVICLDNFYYAPTITRGVVSVSCLVDNGDDRGGEYISQEFKDYLKACGIVLQLTPPYTSQHNRVSKRRNHTLLDMVRLMMNLTTFPLSFWDYALESATRILNMVLTKKVDKTPYELWYGKVPNLSYLKVWGFEPLEKQDTLEKLQQRHVNGRAGELEEIQDEDTSPSKNTSEMPMKVKEVEEHSLGDPNELANYKAVMLDPKSNNIDYVETFSPVADIRAIGILIAIAAFYDYKIWKMDVKIAFLNGYLDEDIYMVFKMDNSKRGNIPMQERLDLNKIQGATTPKEVKRMQNVPYASAVGSIMYAVRYTRPDVAFVNPEAELRVDCYCNAEFETDRDEIKSQTGYVFILNRRRSRLEKLQAKYYCNVCYRS